MAATRHISVLEKESLSYLQASQGGDFLDCTLGGGGHSLAILEAHPENTVFAIDRDERALKRARERLARHATRFECAHSDFLHLQEVLPQGRRFHGILADLGLSTDQLFEERGFSFRDAQTLDMRMDESQGCTAQDIVNSSSPSELLAILRRGGVGNEATALVKAICDTRPIQSAEQLAKLVAQSFPFRLRKKNSSLHPATVVFQALRMEVNKEFENIQALLDHIPPLVKDEGRCVIISFHSLEDELVTRHMRAWSRGDTRPPAFRTTPSHDVKRGDLLTRKAITPSEEEKARNPSSRSARLRAFAFHGAEATRGS